MKRREFIVRIGGVALAAPFAIQAIGCGDDGGDDGGGNIDANNSGNLQDCTTFDIRGPDDGHVMTTISVADIQAAEDKTYMLTGGQHTHMFTITAAQFGELAAGNDIEVESTRDVNHVHPMTIGGCTTS